MKSNKTWMACVVVAVAALVGCAADTNEPEPEPTSNVPTVATGSVAPKACVGWDECGDDPDPGPAPSGPCSLRPAHCCETNAAGKCTIKVSGCMACP